MKCLKKWVMQKRKIDELEREILWCRNEIDTRQAMLKHQGDEILKLQQKILDLEDDKKALRAAASKNVSSLIYERDNKRKDS